ncbi:MAG TPA: crossover junction endodeoxyribonuclease RuvC [Kiritimatiellae bacterium]|nr:crossover junction endodeoxyribonuclease RuvC [Kiritimatiellia bacterium]
MDQAREFVVMGIDASLRATGVGLVSVRGKRVSLLHYHVIRNPARMSHGEGLSRLYSNICHVIDDYSPSVAVLESPFFQRNVRTAITLGEARGVILAACAAAGVPTCQYSPREIKRALVGTGAAHKSQVGFMIRRILGLREPPPADAADALAAAVCHIHRLRTGE